MGNYKVIEIIFNWKNGMTINVPYDAFLSFSVGFLILSLGTWFISKAIGNVIREIGNKKKKQK